MTTTFPQPDAPRDRPDVDDAALLTMRGNLALRWIVARCWARTRALPPSLKKPRRSASLQPGELMMAAPEAAPIDDVLRIVAQLFTRLTVSRAEFVRRPSRDTFDELAAQELVPLLHRFGRVTCTPGVERDLAAAIRVAARHLRKGGFDVQVVQSMRLVQNADPTPSGVICFDSSFLDAIQPLPSGNGGGAGVSVLIVDSMMPAQLCAPGTSVPDGHGTLMYEIAQRIAPGARFSAEAVGDQGGASSWGVLEAVTANRGTDVMIVSLSFDSGGVGKLADDRRAFMSRWLADVTRSPLRPIVVLPTGNARAGQPIHEIAIPGRFEAAVTIGAVNPAGQRASGSRYGRKDGPTPDEWWVAPGGDFDVDDVRTPCATMGGQPQAGTSVANAVAGGMIACLISELRGSRASAPATDDEGPVLQRLVDALPAGTSQRSDLERILRDASLAARGEVTRWNVLTALQERREKLDGQTPDQVGLGRLRI